MSYWANLEVSELPSENDNEKEQIELAEYHHEGHYPNCEPPTQPEPYGTLAEIQIRLREMKPIVEIR